MKYAYVYDLASQFEKKAAIKLANDSYRLVRSQLVGMNAKMRLEKALQSAQNMDYKTRISNALDNVSNDKGAFSLRNALIQIINIPSISDIGELANSLPTSS